MAEFSGNCRRGAEHRNTSTPLREIIYISALIMAYLPLYVWSKNFLHQLGQFINLFINYSLLDSHPYLFNPVIKSLAAAILDLLYFLLLRAPTLLNRSKIRTASRVSVLIKTYLFLVSRDLIICRSRSVSRIIIFLEQFDKSLIDHKLNK